MSGNVQESVLQQQQRLPPIPQLSSSQLRRILADLFVKFAGRINGLPEDEQLKKKMIMTAAIITLLNIFKVGDNHGVTDVAIIDAYETLKQMPSLVFVECKREVQLFVMNTCDNVFMLQSAIQTVGLLFTGYVFINDPSLIDTQIVKDVVEQVSPAAVQPVENMTSVWNKSSKFDEQNTDSVNIGHTPASAFGPQYDEKFPPLGTSWADQAEEDVEQPTPKTPPTPGTPMTNKNIADAICKEALENPGFVRQWNPRTGDAIPHTDILPPIIAALRESLHFSAHNTVLNSKNDQRKCADPECPNDCFKFGNRHGSHLIGVYWPLCGNHVRANNAFGAPYHLLKMLTQKIEHIDGYRDVIDRLYDFVAKGNQMLKHAS